ncbi:MAG: LacI family DNA-binding transcriptional regulator [Spirochaetales bacterium]|nr:LacI family DNA-binding transcriptional regulator [Spirochaetales bacterium]
MKKKHAHNKAVTQDDVARKAGVSRSIVSYVLNGEPRPVAPDTKKRIIAAIEELGYRPNKYAQMLMKSKYDALAEKQFGIVLSDVFMLRRPYYADILAGIHTTAHEKDHHIRFIRFFYDLKDPLLFNELIHREEISGLLLIALDQSIHSEEELRLIRQIRERISNIVCIDWHLEGFPSINFNRQEAAFHATKHLLELGYTDLAYIGPDDNRITGYQQALVQNQLPIQGIYPLQNSNLKTGHDTCMELIAGNRLPRAIFGGTDEVSIGILRCLSKHDIRVPDQVAVISIDNIEMAEYCNPPLTTENVDTFQMGRIAVETLIHRAANPNQIPTLTLLPTRLVVRESCKTRNPGT